MRLSEPLAVRLRQGKNHQYDQQRAQGNQKPILQPHTAGIFSHRCPQKLDGCPGNFPEIDVGSRGESKVVPQRRPANQALPGW